MIQFKSSTPAATHLGQLKTKIDNVLAHYDDLSLTDIQNQITPIIAFAKQVQNTVSQVQNARYRCER
ncbi:hypothetical protein QY884_05210 [Latilactobacillus sakei]